MFHLFRIQLSLYLILSLPIFAQQATKPPIEERISVLMAQMTLEEKIGQMNQYNGFWEATGPIPMEGEAAKKYQDIKSGWVGSMLNVKGVEEVRAVQKIAVEESRLGIPLIIGFDLIHGYKTMSPIPLAEAASWDMEAIKNSARMGAIEAAASGINWTFAPMVDIYRDARWGRVMEGAGEDPYLGSLIAAARVEGFQGDDLSDPLTIAACAKHFAGYGFSESGKDYNTVDVGMNTLYNTILPPFLAAKNAGVRTFMNGFNDLNGIPVTGNAFLQREILKKDWEFDGFIVSDWNSIKEMINHGFAENGTEATRIAVNAGSDMDMESHLYIKELKKLVESGKVSVEKIDDAVRRILRVKFELGLFDDPYLYCNTEREKDKVSNASHKKAALDIAKKSIVLLKNEQNLLPLKKSGQRIALIGPLAADKNSPLGSWRLAAEDDSAISVIEGIQSLYQKVDIEYAQGVELIEGDRNFGKELEFNLTDRTGFESAKKIAKNADVVVMVLGEYSYQTGEGRSQTKLGLPGLQNELLEEIYQVNQNIVLVLMNGRPVIIPWAVENISSIIEAWHLGTESGNAIAKVLFGDYNPSGKLPMTFPRAEGQIPIYYNHKNTGRPDTNDPKSVFWSHYTDETNQPLYPFGYGLSYTEFSYSPIELSSKSLKSGSSIEAKIVLKNTGKVKGKETVQLYIRDLYASVTRPVRELKRFQQIELAPGASKTIVFKIDESMLSFYNNHLKWVAEPGKFEIFIGGDSSAQISAQFIFQK